MKIEEFYADGTIASALGRYLDAKDVSARFEKSVKDLSSDECLIPVLGTQGSGKSSFLDAVLFGDIVLPVDADETTCIPTVVRYGDSSKPSACVVMSDGSRRNVECSESGLAAYVHQEKNPANKKGVSCIEISLKNPILKNGVVFVDLPGVGSITAENHKTTTEYLKKCPAAIFMLRTCPPITESESVFIMGALPLMGRVFWVQNQWVDESSSDAEEGRQENSTRLHDIAKRINFPEAAIYDPDVVCVKRALDGRVTENADMVKKSGVLTFRDKVLKFAADWRNNVLSGKQLQATEMLAAAVRMANRRIEQLSGDAQSERIKIVEEKRRVDEILEQNRQITREARNYLSDRKDSLYNLIDAECQKCVEELRNGVRESIDAGLVGGRRLNKAFADYKNRENENVFNAVQPAFMEVAAQIGHMLQGVQDCTVDMPSLLKPKNTGAGASAFSEKTKVHAFYKLGGSIVGGIGASLAAGAIVSGGVSMAAFGALAATGPVGLVIGGVAALGGMLLGAYCGSKAREAHVESQKETARSELFKAAERFASKLQSEYRQAYESFADEMDRAIRDWVRGQQKVVDERYRKSLIDLELPLKEKMKSIEQTNEDVRRFNDILSSFGKMS